MANCAESELQWLKCTSISTSVGIVFIILKLHCLPQNTTYTDQQKVSFWKTGNLVANNET